MDADSLVLQGNDVYKKIIIIRLALITSLLVFFVCVFMCLCVFFVYVCVWKGEGCMSGGPSIYS